MATTTVRVLVKRPSDMANAGRWIRTRGAEPLEVRLPWMPFQIHDFLSERLPARVFEFGGGGSTAWFNDQGCDVTTVEHDPEWADALSGAVESTVIHHPIKPAPDSYIAAIEPLGSFDVVVVDGRHRVECCRKAVEHVNPGGLLILDDSWRDRYQPAVNEIDWPRQDFEGFQPYVDSLGCTTVWTRPL